MIHFTGIISKPNNPCIRTSEGSKLSGKDLMKASTLNEFLNERPLHLVKYGEDSKQSKPGSKVRDTAILVLSLSRISGNDPFLDCLEFKTSCKQFAISCKTKNITWLKGQLGNKLSLYLFT